MRNVLFKFQVFILIPLPEIFLLVHSVLNSVDVIRLSEIVSTLMRPNENHHRIMTDMLSIHVFFISHFNDKRRFKSSTPEIFNRDPCKNTSLYILPNSRFSYSNQRVPPRHTTDGKKIQCRSRIYSVFC